MSQHEHRITPASTAAARTRRPRPALGLAGLGVATVGLAAVPLLGVAAPALAHDELIGTTAVVDETDGSLEAIELSFSNSIIETGAEMTVTDASGTDVTDGALEISGPDVTQPVADDLSAGDYSAAWRVVSSDGHPIEGFFTVTVEADGAVEIVDEAIAEDDPRSAENAEDHGAEGHAAEGHAAEDGGQSEGAPVGAVIAVVVGGAAVIAGGIAAATVGQRRRARAMRDAAETSGDASEDRA
ncbi:copper resistance protein CopC [Leucobacter zeae]|nr:copper resistance protein CopC [Leucobacter zeae]